MQNNVKSKRGKKTGDNMDSIYKMNVIFIMLLIKYILDKCSRTVEINPFRTVRNIRDNNEIAIVNQSEHITVFYYYSCCGNEM
jgi:hypothetical protein